MNTVTVYTLQKFIDALNDFHGPTDCIFYATRAGKNDKHPTLGWSNYTLENGKQLKIHGVLWKAENQDLFYRYEVSVAPDDEQTVIHLNSADEVAQAIGELYGSMPDYAIGGKIEMPAEDLNTLACAYGKRGDKLLEIKDKVIESIRRQQDLVEEISRLMEGGDA